MLPFSTLCKRRLAPSICFVADTLHLQRKNSKEREQTECPNTGSFDPNDTSDFSEVLVAYMSPHFNLPHKSPKALQRLKCKLIQRLATHCISVFTKLQSGCAICRIALGGNRPIPVAGLELDIKPCIQLQQEKLSRIGEKFRASDILILAASLSRNHSTLLPSMQLLHVSFAVKTGKISAWAITCFFPCLRHIDTKLSSTVSPK